MGGHGAPLGPGGRSQTPQARAIPGGLSWAGCSTRFVIPKYSSFFEVAPPFLERRELGIMAEFPARIPAQISELEGLRETHSDTALRYRCLPPFRGSEAGPHIHREYSSCRMLVLGNKTSPALG